MVRTVSGACFWIVSCCLTALAGEPADPQPGDVLVVVDETMVPFNEKDPSDKKGVLYTLSTLAKAEARIVADEGKPADTIAALFERIKEPKPVVLRIAKAGPQGDIRVMREEEVPVPKPGAAYIDNLKRWIGESGYTYRVPSEEEWAFYSQRPNELPGLGNPVRKGGYAILATPNAYSPESALSFLATSSGLVLQKDLGDVGEEGFAVLKDEFPFSANNGWRGAEAVLLAEKADAAGLINQAGTMADNEGFILDEFVGHYRKIQDAYKRNQLERIDAEFGGDKFNPAVYASRLLKLYQGGREPNENMAGLLVPDAVIRAAEGEGPFAGYRFLEPDEPLFRGNYPVPAIFQYELIATPWRYGQTGRMTFYISPTALMEIDLGRDVGTLDECLASPMVLPVIGQKSQWRDASGRVRKNGPESTPAVDVF